MDKKFISLILEQTESTEIVKTQLIQQLWSGYGELTRIVTDKCSVIMKHIQFPSLVNHPKGFNSDFAHKRKIKSYQVEMNWYQNFTKHLPQAKSATMIACGEIDNTFYILMEDLFENEFVIKKNINWNEVKQCLNWLAHFHAVYLNHEPTNLWEVGTYWNLATRPDEFEQISDKDIKENANKIDLKLNSAQYKTIVHGDAKLANFLFNNETVSAVDFQYVGGGVGIKDVAYFLSSIYNQEELYVNEKRCLDFYFDKLFSLTQNQELIEEWRNLYSLAWADFYRFLLGWSPEHYKMNSYIKDQTQKAINAIKSKSS